MSGCCNYLTKNIGTQLFFPLCPLSEMPEKRNKATIEVCAIAVGLFAGTALVLDGIGKICFKVNIYEEGVFLQARQNRRNVVGAVRLIYGAALLGSAVYAII